MPKVSIIVPFRNAENKIEETIKNIEKQKYKDFELILVNDGSEDNSEKIIKKYLQNPKIKYYYTEKDTIGVGKARNIGMEKSIGKYIMFVDSDDKIDEELLLNLNKYMEKNIEIIKYKMKIIQNKVIYTKGPVFDVCTGENGFNKICFYDKYLDSPCLYLINRNFIKTENLKFAENVYHEDFGLIPKLIIKAKTMVSTDYYGYLYFLTDESITRNNDYNKIKKRTEDKIFHYKELDSFLETINVEDKTKNNLKEYYTNSIIASFKDLKKEDLKIMKKKYPANIFYKNIKQKGIKKIIKRIFLFLRIY